MTDAAEQQGNSFSITRILKAPAERVYRAFLDPAAMVKWSAPHGFIATIDDISPLEGVRIGCLSSISALRSATPSGAPSWS